MGKSLKDKIAQRAFELFTERGGHDGYAIDDWLRAEQEILASGAKPKARKKTAKKKAAPKKTAAAKKKA